MSNKEKKEWWKILTPKDKSDLTKITFGSRNYEEKPKSWILSLLFKNKNKIDDKNS